MKRVARIAAQVAITMWLGIATAIGLSISYDCAGIIGALATGIFMVCVGGFLEVLIYQLAKEELGG